MQHMGVSTFPSRAAPHAPGCSRGVALMWLQLLPWPPQSPVLCQALGSSSVPSQPLPLLESPCALVQAPLYWGCRGVERLHRGVRAEGIEGLGAPGRAHSPARALCCRRRFARCIRALCEQHNLSFLPSLPACFAITAGSRWEMGGWWRGCGDRDRGEDGGWGSLPGPVGCIPIQLGLSSEAAAERSRQGSVLGDSDGGSEWGTVPRAHQGCNAQVLCCGSPSGYSAQERCRGSFARDPHWGTMLGTGAAVPQRHISALLTSTAPPKCSCPEPPLSWGANSPLGSGGPLPT